MLISLSIRDVVLIDHLELEFGRGLCALSGETGAGKSILLDALGLALGGRADAALVRDGADQATVAAEFRPAADHSVRGLLADQGLDVGDDTLILRRVLGADGRSRAFINDLPVGVGLLREVGDQLVEVQGQASQRGILGAEMHRVFLDGFAGHDDRTAKVAATHHKMRETRQALADAEAELAEARRNEDYLRHVLAELDALAPEPGEEATLATRRGVLMHGEKLAESLAGAIDELSDGRGVEERLRAAQRHLTRSAERAAGAFDGAIDALERAVVEINEALAALETARRELAPDPARLDAAEERLFALRAAARKHQTDVDSLAGLRDGFGETLAALDDRGEALAGLTQAADKARDAFVAAARRLSKARATAARDLDRRVIAELPALKLDNAVFVTRLEPLPEADWGADGAERVRFEVATNPGATPGPLMRIASGGELSRLLLALRVVLARVGTAPTLVFDEVDSGIGGAVAAAVGDRLARLDDELQVLVVTHSPQVAARAVHHFRVIKDETKTGATTRVDALDDAARREEVARMLAGKLVTDEARAAADSLIRASAD